MNKAVMYVHGKGGNVGESDFYKDYFRGCEIVGIDYKGDLPWVVREEIERSYNDLSKKYDEIFLIANSIGAYYSVISLQNKPIKKRILSLRFWI